MAVNPIAKFEHVWHALMRVMGIGHRDLYRRNKLLLHDFDRNLRVK